MAACSSECTLSSTAGIVTTGRFSKYVTLVQFVLKEIVRLLMTVHGNSTEHQIRTDYITVADSTPM
jgi:hypothetical protein